MGVRMWVGGFFGLMGGVGGWGVFVLVVVDCVVMGVGSWVVGMGWF